jgi:hypothetical protein
MARINLSDRLHDPTVFTSREERYFVRKRRLASSLSVLWWTVSAVSGSPLLVAMSGSCKCCNPSVFTLRQTHPGSLVTEDLGISLFADHIRAQTESFHSKVADAGNPLIRQLGRHLCWLNTYSYISFLFLWSLTFAGIHHNSGMGTAFSCSLVVTRYVCFGAVQCCHVWPFSHCESGLSHLGCKI